MRLKTLRKERPAFENEGAVINGNRMDLSNSEFKPAKQRSNNTFALPTSLNHELSSLTISASDQIHEIHPRLCQQTSIRRSFLMPASTQATHTSSYQAIEAAYREHGIRIQLSSTTAAAVSQQQIQSTENLTGRKSGNSLQRHKAFVNRNPSRSSSALHYSTNRPDLNQDSRPFSALQQTSTTDFEQINMHNVSYAQPMESQHTLQSSEQLNNNYCSSSVVQNEYSNPITPPLQLANTNGTTTLIDNDPDLAYMSSLLKTTSGDSFRDTIRRRAGLRATFAVHRHPQPIATTTATMLTTNSKREDKSPIAQPSTNNRRNSLQRNATIAVVPAPSSKKVEKDILKHASRIRTSQLKDYFPRHQNSVRSYTSEHISSVSNSPTRINHHDNKRNKILKPSKSISLEPLELLLAPAPRPLPPPPRATSLSSRDLPIINRNNYQTNTKVSKKRTKSPQNSFVENNHSPHDGITNSFSSNEHFHSSLLNDDSLPLMKTSPLDMIMNDKTHQSNSFDSGCYDRSSSADTRSITSLSINQPASSIPSARLTSSGTRRSNIIKKVSFDDQSTTVIVTTATYV